LRTDELDVPESAGDSTLRSSTICDPEPTGAQTPATSRSLKLQLTYPGQSAGSHEQYYSLVRDPSLDLDR
jgi:hypothetical protein